jgi:hypothetical protein
MKIFRPEHPLTDTKAFDLERPVMYSEYFITTGWNGKGRFLSLRTFGRLGGNADWQAVANLEGYEIHQLKQWGVKEWPDFK